MDIDEFINQLKEKFYNKNTWFKSGHALQDSVYDTIKSFLLKKNLVIISKAEYDQLKTKIQ